ncbi:MAG: hypothetical protein OHK0024_07120 [Thalassobaculales bacterium]
MPLERIREQARLSVGRGCGFGLLAICTFVIGFIPLPLVAARLAAILTTLMAVILVWQAWRSPRRRYRDTELWIMLDRNHGLPEDRAQGVIMGILGEVYMRHAEATAAGALVLWALSLLLWLTQAA